MTSNVAAARKHRYGLTLTDYSNLLKKQAGKCVCCGEGETKLGRSGSVRSLCVDHCHATGKIRGLLCDRCNRVLGFVSDDIQILRRLAAYLEVADTGYKMPGSQVCADSLVNELSSL
jgi:hypothetical protein